jgi:hypothetical protein
VQEVRSAPRPGLAATAAAAASGSNGTAVSSAPSVELGTLQALVSDCGGHLWMEAEPPGDMVLKIHLPRRALDRLDQPAAAKQPGRTKWISRLAGARH